MSVKTICTYPQKVLLTKADDVDFSRQDLKAIVKDMIDTMYEAGGIGIAAPQIGIGLRIFVMDTKHHVTLERRPRVFFNPTYEPLGSAKQKEVEGCLSLPGASQKVERWDQVKITAFDIYGGEFSMEVSGLEAACVQHECDHLNGQLYISHLGQIKRKRALKCFQAHKSNPERFKQEKSEHPTDTSTPVKRDPSSTAPW